MVEAARVYLKDQIRRWTILRLKKKKNERLIPIDLSFRSSAKSEQ